MNVYVTTDNGQCIKLGELDDLIQEGETTHLYLRESVESYEIVPNGSEFGERGTGFDLISVRTLPSGTYRQYAGSFIRLNINAR